jgi:ArsR family transcriptional regulator
MVEATTAVFDALGDQLRLRMIDRLAEVGSGTPNELADYFGVSQQNVSKHLKTLTQAGLIKRRQDGSSAIYSLRDAAVTMIVDEAAALALRGLRELSSSAGLVADDGDRRRDISGADHHPRRRVPRRVTIGLFGNRSTVIRENGSTGEGLRL